MVITDRYVDSTLAYQGAGRALDVREVEEVARWATGDVRPHLTVAARRGPARRPGPVRGPGPDRGGVASTSTSVPGSRSWTSRPPTPTTTSCSTPAPTATSSPTGSCDRVEPLLGQATARPELVVTDRLGRPGRPAPDRRAAAHRGGRPRHEPRVAVHRAAGLRPLQRGHRVRRGAAVRAGGPDDKGCGTCPQCHTVLAGSHPDVTLVRTAKLSHRRRRTSASSSAAQP